jgi:hypothetical protein
MDSRVIYCDQGAPEWYAARAGVITASMFQEIQERLKGGPNKGDYTKAARDYAFRLAIERIAGEPLDVDAFQTWAMRRGHELEPEARDIHGMLYDLDIKRAGFVVSTDGRFGASADGLIDPDGGSEYKCFVDPAKLREIIIDGNIDDYKAQCQGGMLLTGRSWWDFCLYCPALRAAGKDLWRFPMERDEAYIERLTGELEAFDKVVEGYRRDLLDKVDAAFAETAQAQKPAPRVQF